MKSRKAFTLIELLVVIAVIGILSAVVAISTNGAKIKARDAQRKGDLLKIASALEIYRTDNKSYPSYSTTAKQTVLNLALTNSLVPTYLPTMPTDPQNSSSVYYDQQYVYTSDSTTANPAVPVKSTKFSLYAVLERPSSADTATVPVQATTLCPKFPSGNQVSSPVKSPSYAVVGNCK
ncbi:MAG: prepilin-type N-terminal cleavage/methylation domain-containing protein [Candidatus Berkelbacteria bacterium]